MREYLLHMKGNSYSDQNTPNVIIWQCGEIELAPGLLLFRPRLRVTYYIATHINRLGDEHRTIASAPC